MLIRIILFAAIVWLAWRTFHRWQRAVQKREQKPEAPFELMQRCSQCGAYLPANALSRSGRCGRCAD